MFASPRLTTGLFVVLVALTTSGLASAQSTAQSTKKAPPAGEAFKDNGNGTVTDTNAGIMWQQDDDGKQRTWSAAVNACASLSLGGHSDWRLPSLTWLISLYKNAGSKSEVRKKYFPGMKSEQVVLPSGSVGPYWSSDPGPDSIPNSRIVVNFHDGSLQAAQVGGIFSIYSRCARSAK